MLNDLEERCSKSQWFSFVNRCSELNIDVNQITDKTLIVFDTNILLNFYFVEDLNSLDLYIEFLKDYIWVPYQVYSEFMVKRNDKINEIRKSIEGIAEFEKSVLTKMYNMVKEYDQLPMHYGKHIKSFLAAQFKEVSEYIKHETEEIKEISEKVGELNNSEKDCYFAILLKNAFINREEKYTEEEMRKINEEAIENYKKGNKLPGYSDYMKSKMKKDFVSKDYIIWKEIVDIAIELKKDIIFVTEDTKEEKTYPEYKNNLIQTFKNKTGQKMTIMRFNDLVKITSESSESFGECIRKIQQERYFLHITNKSLWDKVFLYHETLELIVNKRRYEHLIKDYDIIAYKELYSLREILERDSIEILCGPIFKQRYALIMDVFVKKGGLLRAVCQLCYKTEDCLLITIQINDYDYIEIANENGNDKPKDGYLEELINGVMRIYKNI